jgi:hypothetical protein
MVRHVVREVVKFGHWDEYIAATKVFNEAATKAGLPAYRVYSSDWGTFNEAFSEAEYESSADIEARFAVAIKDSGYRAALTAMASHYVDGEVRDYVLSEVDPGEG